MTEAGFHLAIADNGHIEPGIWVAESEIGGEPFLIPVDLIVPEGYAPPGGRRGAALVLTGTGQRDVRVDWKPHLSIRAR